MIRTNSNGFRKIPDNTKQILDSCRLMITDLMQSNRGYSIAQFNKKHRKWAQNNVINSKTLSGYHSFIVENTKVF